MRRDSTTLLSRCCHGVLLWLLLGGGTAVRAESTAKPWALQPVEKPPLPVVRDGAWPKTPVDRFVLARLEQRSWRPAPAADKRTLLRRVTFDLTGLPPTPLALDTFLADTSPEAYERVVDRLLASSAYGERWGRHWLDVARYADNKGYVFFEERTYPWAWTYRDYVVRSLNDDKPYNQFLLEQIAADQLGPNPDGRTLAALGFITVGDHFSNNTHDILDDRIDVVTRGLLGLTVGCARCHDHKYDPVTMADYYALYGVFRSSSEPMVPPLLEAPPDTNPYACFAWELSERERRLREYVEAKHGAIVKEALDRIAEYLLAVHAQRGQPTTESFMLLADKGDLNPTVIARWRRCVERAGPSSPVWSLWHALAELEPANFASKAPGVIAASLASKQPALNPRLAAAFAQGDAPTNMVAVATRYATVLKAIETAWSRQREASGGTLAAKAAGLPNPADEELRRVLYGPDAPPDIPLQLDWGFLSLLPDRASQGEFQVLLKELEQWLMQGPGAPARAMVLSDLPVAYEPRVFERGNPNRLGKVVPRRFLSALQGRPFEHGSGRLDLAQAVVDPSNPLTARVFVNRVWLHHFGAGLVNTPSDFGVRSDPPSHPELLDWLAADFMENGWGIKRLHRQMVLSATYQQTSDAPEPPSNGEVRPDPENHLLWRMNRRRHDFETQRDSLLAVSGRLESRLGGAPDAPETSLRRTLYGFINRLDLPPVMATFDFPSPSVSCPQRAMTTVPSQALYLMNHTFTAECAAAVMRCADVSGVSGTSGRVEAVYRRVLTRSPRPGEIERALTYLGPEPSPLRWESWVQALLLTNEFVFVD